MIQRMGIVKDPKQSVLFFRWDVKSERYMYFQKIETLGTYDVYTVYCKKINSNIYSSRSD